MNNNTRTKADLIEVIISRNERFAFQWQFPWEADSTRRRLEEESYEFLECLVDAVYTPGS